MSHIVLEGPRKTCITNVKGTAHACARSRHTTLVILLNFLGSQVQGSITLLIINFRPEVLPSKTDCKNTHSPRHGKIFFFNPIKNCIFAIVLT